MGGIDTILEADLAAPKKQRHTVQRIYHWLKAEHGFGGGYTTVRVSPLSTDGHC